MIRRTIYLILAAVCILYGVSIFLLRSGSKFFLVWIAMGAGFACLAWCAAHGIWAQIPAAAKILICLAVICFLGAIGAAEMLVLRDFRDRGEPGLDGILVLGAQVWPSGPSFSLKYRLDTAAAYLEENPDTYCIVSGGQGYNEPFTEARGMYDYLVMQGIAPDRIRREEQSTNTAENIRYSMSLMDTPEDSLGIVTNDFHVYRGTAIARAQGIRGAVGIAAPSNHWYLPNNMFREAFGIAKDFLQGNL